MFILSTPFYNHYLFRFIYTHVTHKALCHIHPVVGRMINNKKVFSFKNGNADGVEGIFGLAGRVWALALRPDPP